MKNGQNSTDRQNRLKQLGLNLGKWDYVVALAGNPNTGKSTVFNNLTGLKQHTGNWPGKTVTRAEGGYEYKNRSYKLVDLPGTYSLLSASEDEEIARNFILFGRPDVTVIVVDATRLQHNLNLTLQIMEITGNVVVCLNLMDEAERKGIKVNAEALQEKLGVPVIPAVARQKEGMEELIDAVYTVADEGNSNHQQGISMQQDEPLSEAIEELTSDLKSIYPDLPNTRWIAMRLLDGDERIIEALKSGELESLTRTYRQEPLDLEKELEAMNQTATG